MLFTERCEMFMIVKKKCVNPQKLYPLVTIESLDPKKLDNTVSMMNSGKIMRSIEVIVYEGYYFILEGNYEMLAANILKMPLVDVEIIDRKKMEFWKNDLNLENQLQCIGMNAVYDFEGIGGFEYDECPVWYRRRGE